MCFSIVEEDAGTFVDEEGGDAARHGADAGDGGDGTLWKHVADGGVEVGRPGLMPCSGKSDDDGWPPGTVLSQRLCEEGEDGQEGEEQHGAQATGIGFHATALDEELGQIASGSNADDGDYQIDGEEQHGTHRGIAAVAILVAEIGWSPEEQEPPYAVGEELTADIGPGVAEGETLN